MEVSLYEAPQPEEESTWDKLRAAFAELIKKRFFWPALLAVVVVFSLVLSLILIPFPSTPVAEDLESGESEVTSSVSEAPETSIAKILRIDSDDDGFFDDQEIEGWKTKGGSVYQTDPFSADSDGDGLTDMEEAGPLLTEADSDELTYQGISNPLKADSDDDGLDDKIEIKGWLDTTGKKYVTNPLDPDTDGDGLHDGLETGPATKEGDYEILSDPTRVDSDNDGLSDAEELNQDTDPFSKDSDNDGLSDGEEVLKIGTDPGMPDTDGDGFDDRYELEHMVSKDLDPLFHDVRMSTMDNATDFAIGAVLGDFKQRDSIAWLVGSLTVMGIGMIPVIGTAVGVIADLRDAAAASIRQDWVSAGFAATGLLPFAGDTSAMTRKISKFLNRTNDMQYAVSKMINRLPLLSNDVKKQLRQATWGTTWKELKAKGYTDHELDQLATKRNDLKLLNETLESKVIIGKPMKPVKTGLQGELVMEDAYKKSGYAVHRPSNMSTKACTNGSNSISRTHDLHVELDPGKIMAVEAKVGHHSLTASIMKQLQSDICLRDMGLISVVRWEFMPSKVTGQVGLSKPLREFLEQNGIEILIRNAK